MVLPPFYYKPQSDDSVFRFYSELILSVDEPRLRIIFYNFPKLSGYNFNVKILQKLKQRFGDTAAGIKDSSGEWKNMLGIVQNIPDFMLYTGTENFLLDILKKGGAGCITATANLIAPECQRVYQAWKNNKQKVAEQAQINLTDLRKTLENYPFVSELKSLFASKTNAEEWGNMLPPFAPILDKQVEELTEQIKGLGLDLKLRL